MKLSVVSWPHKQLKSLGEREKKVSIHISMYIDIVYVPLISKTNSFGKIGIWKEKPILHLKQTEKKE